MTATYRSATGARATQVAESLDAIEGQLATFVRGAVRWLDAGFPQRGDRGAGQAGEWTEGDVHTVFVETHELAGDGRGLRLVRLVREPAPDGVGTRFARGDGALRVIAAGLAEGSELELRWNFTASETGLVGTSVEVTVDGPNAATVVDDFRHWFG